MMSRILGLLALILLAAGFVTGTAAPAHAMAHHHHAPAISAAGEPCTPEVLSSAEHAADCATHHGGFPVHRHGAAGCLCAVGACDLSALPARLAVAVYGPVDILLPATDQAPSAFAPAPPLKPPRA